MYSPDAPAVNSCVSCVPVFVMTILAWGTTAPLGSVTVPRMSLVTTCAIQQRGAQSNTAQRMMRRVMFSNLLRCYRSILGGCQGLAKRPYQGAHKEAS